MIGTVTDEAFATVSGLIKLATSPEACAKRMAELAASEKKLTELEKKVAAAQAAFAERERQAALVREKTEAALAQRYATVKDLEDEMRAREEWCREIEIDHPTRRPNYDTDFRAIGGSGLTKERARS
jgi:septal ring factor EnvC (AmiA/AmiB activator)